MILVEPACGEHDIVIYACIVHLSRFVWAITSTFMHGFQNNLAVCCPRRVEVPFETPRSAI